MYCNIMCNNVGVILVVVVVVVVVVLVVAVCVDVGIGLVHAPSCVFFQVLVTCNTTIIT